MPFPISMADWELIDIPFESLYVSSSPDIPIFTVLDCQPPHMGTSQMRIKLSLTSTCPFSPNTDDTLLSRAVLQC